MGRRWRGDGEREVSHIPLMIIQEASRHADELLEAEEKEKREAEKKRQKNKKVSKKFGLVQQKPDVLFFIMYIHTPCAI